MVGAGIDSAACGSGPRPIRQSGELMIGTDGILVRQVLSGNKDAFEPLVERYKGTVYALVVGKTGNFTYAEDIVQGTFVEAFQHLKSLKDPARFRAWVRGIAMNLSNEWIRKRKRNVPIDDLDNSKEAAIHSEVLPESYVRLPTAPDGDYEMEEMRNYVLRAVERLPERYREVVLLHYMEGLKYREIAEMLEVPESTVLGRLQVGRDQLREELLPIVEETLKEQQPTSELTRKVMAALPPMLLLTPDSSPLFSGITTLKSIRSQGRPSLRWQSRLIKSTCPTLPNSPDRRELPFSKAQRRETQMGRPGVPIQRKSRSNAKHRWTIHLDLR